ncbi:MAG: arginine repressor [Planctomycetota bacterium]|jgi:transcriptional regulator of arginine metabolism|nr:arginine repressor [Planctomycetota bacterium]
MNMTLTMKKAERQNKILELIHAHPVATQVELKALLKKEAVEVDQATLSRDLRELGLIRVSTPEGFRYASLEEVTPVARVGSRNRIQRLIKKFDVSGNLIVIRTAPGDAQAVSLAIDRSGWSEVLGTVAGDDTLLVVVAEGVSANKVINKIQKEK